MRGHGIRTPLAAALAALLHLTGCSGPSTPPEPGASGPADDSLAVSAVLAVEDSLFTALVRRDTATLSRLLTPDFALGGPGEELESRAQYLSSSLMPQRSLEPIELHDRQVRLHGPTAVSTGWGRLRGTLGDRPLDLRYRYTTVFVAEDGRWQATASHISPFE